MTDGITVLVERCAGLASPERIEDWILETLERQTQTSDEMCHLCAEWPDCVWCEGLCMCREPRRCPDHEQSAELLDMLRAMRNTGSRPSEEDPATADADHVTSLLGDALLGLGVHLTQVAHDVELESHFFTSQRSLVFPHLQCRPWGPIVQSAAFARLMLPDVDPRFFADDEHVIVVPDEDTLSCVAQFTVPEKPMDYDYRDERTW